MEQVKGVGKRLKMWRKNRKLKLKEVIKIIEISQGSLSDIENGKSNPSAYTIVQFMTKTDINIWWLLTGKHEEINKGVVPLESAPPLTIHINEGQEILIKRND